MNKHLTSTVVAVARCACGRPVCVPLGDADPEELTCGHVFKYDMSSDALVCRCGVRISGEMLYASGFSQHARHNQELADKLQALTDENREVFAENARLRRTIEQMERKRK